MLLLLCFGVFRFCVLILFCGCCCLFYFWGFGFVCVRWFLVLFWFFSVLVASEMLKAPALCIRQGNT